MTSNLHLAAGYHKLTLGIIQVSNPSTKGGRPVIRDCGPARYDAPAGAERDRQRAVWVVRQQLSRYSLKPTLLTQAAFILDRLD